MVACAIKKYNTKYRVPIKKKQKLPAHLVSIQGCDSWEALVPAHQECFWSPSCYQGKAEAIICSIHLRIPKHEWNLGSPSQKSGN